MQLVVLLVLFLALLVSLQQLVLVPEAYPNQREVASLLPVCLERLASLPVRYL